MTQRKGLADLFAAFRLLKRSDVELVVMGSPLASHEFYRSELPDFQYEPPRPHAEVLKLMQSCDVFVLPSIVEGRALVQQEAMACGLPLIVTANAGAEDVIDEGETGFLVPIRSPEVIAERIAILRTIGNCSHRCVPMPAPKQRPIHGKVMVLLSSMLSKNKCYERKMNIATICSSLELGRDGVGDYSRYLARECVRQGHLQSIIALNDRHCSQQITGTLGKSDGDATEAGASVPILRLPNTDSWENRTREAGAFLQKQTPDWLSLQFVCYGFNDKGIVAQQIRHFRTLQQSLPEFGRILCCTNCGS